MNSFMESWAIFSRLSGAQKFVLMRVFVAINVAAYFLATQHNFDNDVIYVGTLVVVYALESAFMLWLGFKRGIGFYRLSLGIGASMPLTQRSAGWIWYALTVGLSMLLTVVAGLIITSIDDDSGLASIRAIAFLSVEAISLGFALLQGLRLGWNAVAMIAETVTPMGVQGSGSRMDATVPLDASISPTEVQVRTKKRAKNIRRGQIALGCISVLCAGLAIYFHLVAHEMAKPDPENDAATETVAQALGNGAASTTNTPEAPQPDVLPPDDPRVNDVIAKAAQVARETGTAQDIATFSFPVAAGSKSPDGYPIYQMECNVEANTCFGGEGQAYGTIIKMADQLTPIRNSDAMTYTCIQRVCVDQTGNYVGAISSAMQAYWDARHRPAQGFHR